MLSTEWGVRVALILNRIVYFGAYGNPYKVHGYCNIGIGKTIHTLNNYDIT